MSIEGNKGSKDFIYLSHTFVAGNVRVLYWNLFTCSTKNILYPILKKPRYILIKCGIKACIK